MPLHPISDSFLQQVLAPYRANARYIADATWHHPAELSVPVQDDPSSWIRVEGRGSIASSCYADDSGHFNAVELNIVYNQMMYLGLASCAAAGLTHVVPWGAEAFFRHQLTDVLIRDYHARFERPINPRDFSVRLEIRSARVRPERQMLWMHTACAVSCAMEGAATAEVTVALVRVR